MKPVVKRTTLWRQRRLRQKAIELGKGKKILRCQVYELHIGVKLSMKMRRCHSDNYISGLQISADALLTSEPSPSVMSMSEDDLANETETFEKLIMF